MRSAGHASLGVLLVGAAAIGLLVTNRLAAPADALSSVAPKPGGKPAKSAHPLDPLTADELAALVTWSEQ